MYWLYLIIFILAVFSPDIVHRGLFLLDSETSFEQIRMLEELSIFSLGMVGFLIYLWKDKQLKLNKQEKSKIQQEFTQVSKDLNESYSYIGEINRKLDIMKNIALGFPESSSRSISDKTEIYNTITEALKVLGKTNKFTIRVVDDISNNTKKEIKGNRRIIFKIKNNSLKLMQDNDSLKNDDYYVFRSSQKIDQIRTYIIIQRERNNQIEDPELIKTLANQILFLYTLSGKFKMNS